MFDDPHTWTMIGRIALAALLAAPSGWNREAAARPAGLRTYLLVAVGAAAFAAIAMSFVERPMAVPSGVQIDPARILGSIVGGIGFLGAGSIIREQGNIAGVTTAAGIWAMAAVGMASGMGLYAVAVVLALMTFITLTVLPMVEPR